MNEVAALLVAVCVSVLSAIALAFPLAGLSPEIAAASLGAGGVAGAWQYCASRRNRKQTGAVKISGWDWLVIVAFALFSLRSFCWLVFRNDDQIQILSPNNLGDLALHITYIKNLANGVPFWPENPIFAGSKIHYPLGIDVFNSLLTLTGVDVYRGLIWVGLVSCLLAGVAFYKWGKGFALAGFLFNGGLAGFLFFSKTGFLLKDFQSELAWKSIPLSMFITQRGMLYAIPAGLVLLCSWRERFFSNKPDNERQLLPFWVEVLLYATMPLFHLHTFIFLSLLLGCWLLLLWTRPSQDLHSKNINKIVKLAAWLGALALVVVTTPILFWPHAFLFLVRLLFHLQTLVFLSLVLGSWLLLFRINIYRNSQSRNTIPILKLVGCAFIPATVLIALITGGFRSTSLVHFASDWMYGDQPQFAEWARGFGLPSLCSGILGHVACWVVNYGLFPFFIVALVGVLIRNRGEPSSRDAIAFVFPSVLIFIFSWFVMLAPWDWDNTKIMIWPYFVVLPFLWDHLLAKRSLLLRGSCCFVLYFSGFVTLLGGIDGSHTGYEFASSSELDGVATAVRPLPVTAVFAAFPTYNHPLSLDGRYLVAGYPGHLWSHGIDSKNQLAKLDSLFNGEEGWQETARELHASYLFWGEREKKAYPESTQPWKDSCPKVAEGTWGEIYDLTSQLPSAHTH